MPQAQSKEPRENEVIVSPSPAKGMRFWLAMICIMLSTFLAALDSVSGMIRQKFHIPLN